MLLDLRSLEEADASVGGGASAEHIVNVRPFTWTPLLHTIPLQTRRHNIGALIAAYAPLLNDYEITLLLAILEEDLIAN